jgi:hypothetical protein
MQSRCHLKIPFKFKEIQTPKIKKSKIWLFLNGFAQRWRLMSPNKRFPARKFPMIGRQRAHRAIANRREKLQAGAQKPTEEFT